MEVKSFALKFLPCVIILVVLLWQLRIEPNALFAKPAMKKAQRGDTIYTSQTNAQFEKPTFKEVQSGNVSYTSQNNTKSWLIVYYSTFFGRRLNLHEKWSKGECPVPCEITSDPSRASEADGIVIHGRDAKVAPPVKSVPWILQIQENPVYTPLLNNANFMSKFNLLKSYRLDSDFPNPTVLLPKLTPPIPFKNKSGLVMAAFSNCERVRTEYMRQLMKFVQVDSYGSCLHNKNGLTRRYRNQNGKDFRDIKSDLARQYKFTLVFFNQDCDYFVDAQLHHAWNAGSVPVVMATDKLDEFLPGPYLNHSVIKVRNFETPQLLADYLKYLSNNEAEYNKYLEWKWKGYGDITGTAIGDYWMPKYPIYCKVCVALAEGRIHKDGLKPIPCKARQFEDWKITKGG